MSFRAICGLQSTGSESMHHQEEDRLLDIPFTQRKTFAHRALSAIGPCLWNTVLMSVHTTTAKRNVTLFFSEKSQEPPVCVCLCISRLNTALYSAVIGFVLALENWNLSIYLCDHSCCSWMLAWRSSACAQRIPASVLMRWNIRHVKHFCHFHCWISRHRPF